MRPTPDRAADGDPLTRVPAHRRGRPGSIRGHSPQVIRYFPGLPSVLSGRKSVSLVSSRPGSTGCPDSDARSMWTGYLAVTLRFRCNPGRLMPDWFIPRACFAVAAAGLVAAAVAAPAAAAAAASGAGGPGAIGGTKLSGRGVIVDYGSSRAAKLPGVQASAFVIADAGTGQVLAAKDPHGWYRPASTLKVLTAISLIPLLNPNATVVATKQATSVSPTVVGLLPGHAYKVSDLFTALLTISANDAAVALTQPA